jgi:hypothetical protein
MPLILLSGTLGAFRAGIGRGRLGHPTLLGRFPLHLQKLTEMGVSKRVALTVFPLSYLFSRDGAALRTALNRYSSTIVATVHCDSQKTPAAV